jgi:hypothetical protein
MDSTLGDATQDLGPDEKEMTLAPQMPQPPGLNPRDMRIIEALFALSPGGPRVVTYEDIVVRAWELHPSDFGLRGYAEKYPDASDIHKRLYNRLKSQGWVRTVGQKKFALTPPGWEWAEAIFSGAGALRNSASGSRLGRTTQLEIDHLRRSKALELYAARPPEQILDTDFYAFYRTSVRAAPQEFEARLVLVDSALSQAERAGLPDASALREVDQFLRREFDETIKIKSEHKRRSG